MSLRAQRGNLSLVSLRAQRGNLIREIRERFHYHSTEQIENIKLQSVIFRIKKGRVISNCC